MFVETIPVGVFRCNCTIIACEWTRKAIVVDPGDEPERILAVVRKNDLDVHVIVHTHAHLDHIMGTVAVVEATGAEARLHGADRSLWDSSDRVAASYHIPPQRRPALGKPLEDNETLYFGNAAASVIHTPGHTSGSCCFYLDLNDGRELVLSGDTLFRGRIGLPHRGTGDSKSLVASIQTRLLVLDDDTLVIPGHGPMTEIGFERRNNAYLK
jgi:hydroxyacylglutathione hydrolase